VQRQIDHLRAHRLLAAQLDEVRALQRDQP
jgi:hypothetical protein